MPPLWWTIQKQSWVKRHLKTHTYKQAKYKCEECDFVWQYKITMEVHIKHHSLNVDYVSFEQRRLKAKTSIWTHVNCESLDAWVVREDIKHWQKSRYTFQQKHKREHGLIDH